MQPTKPPELWHLFPNGRVEIGTGKPGYRWSPAYSQATATGVSIPLCRYDWFAMARRDGARCVFHDNESDARAAARRP